jgi:hypothetical protein
MIPPMIHCLTTRPTTRGIVLLFVREGNLYAEK